MSLFLQFFRERKLGHFFFAVGLVLWVVLIAFSLQLVVENREVFQKLLEAYPQEILNFLAGSGVSVLDIFTPEGYLTIEFLGLWYPIILLSYLLAYTTSIVSREYETGTIETVLAQPVSRTRFILEKFLAVFSGGLLLALITGVSLIVSASLFDFDIPSSSLMFVSITGYLFVLPFGLLNLFLSTIFLEKSKPIGISLGLFVVMHLITALSQNIDWLDRIDPVSLFYYYKPAKILNTGEFMVKESILFIVISALLLLFSILIFRKRDIAID